MHYKISPWLFLVFVIGIVALKMSVIPSLFLGVFIGSFVAMITQKGVGFIQVIEAMSLGVQSNTGNPMVDVLLSRCGMRGMYNTLALIHFSSLCKLYNDHSSSRKN